MVSRVFSARVIESDDEGVVSSMKKRFEKEAMENE